MAISIGLSKVADGISGGAGTGRGWSSNQRAFRPRSFKSRSAITEYLLPGGRHGVAMYPCWEEYYWREWHEETHERKWREREAKGVYRALPSKDVARRVRGSGSSRRGSG